MIGVSIACGLLCLVGAGYRLAWRRRYGSALFAAGVARVRGRVLQIQHEPSLDDPGVAPTVTLLLHQGRRAWPVTCGGAQATFQVGDRITVDGVWTHMLGDRCYREASGREVVKALRVRAGAWPALRWLPLPSGLLAAGAITALLLAASSDDLFRATAAQVSCPRGSTLASSRTARGWTHWCRRPGRRFDGPWTAWSAGGAPLERGDYREDRKHGRWTEWYADGRTRQDRVFLDGVQHGQDRAWWRTGSPALGRVCKSGERRDEEWSPDPLTLVRQSWYRGTAHGVFQVPSPLLMEWRSVLDICALGRWSGCPPPDPCLVLDRRTFWHGLAHGPVRQWPREGGTLDGWLWLGRPHGRWWGTPGSTRGHYLYGYSLLNPEDPDPRLQSLLERARRLQRGFEEALAEWDRRIAPGASPAALPRSSLDCETAPPGEGCRDERGRQGLWVLEPGLDEVIYVDGLPVAACGIRGGFFASRSFESSCTWLDLPKDGGPPSWWSP